MFFAQQFRIQATYFWLFYLPWAHYLLFTAVLILIIFIDCSSWLLLLEQAEAIFGFHFPLGISFFRVNFAKLFDPWFIL